MTFNFQVKNPHPTPTLVYFRADGIPAAWTRSLTPAKKLLATDEVAVGKLNFQANPTAPSWTISSASPTRCTSSTSAA